MQKQDKKLDMMLDLLLYEARDDPRGCFLKTVIAKLNTLLVKSDNEEDKFMTTNQIQEDPCLSH